MADDEKRDDVEVEDEEHAPGSHAFFRPQRIAVAMIVIAIIAVLIGMGGGGGSGEDKRAEIYAANKTAAERADHIAGFPEENAAK